MCLIADSIASFSDPRSSKNLRTVLRLRSLAYDTVLTPIDFPQAVKRQFPSASTSPPWLNRKTIEAFWSWGCFHSTPLDWIFIKCLLCWSSKDETFSQEDVSTTATGVIAGDDWSTRSIDDGVEVGSRHGITGDDAVESQMSFPILDKKKFVLFGHYNGGNRKWGKKERVVRANGYILQELKVLMDTWTNQKSLFTVFQVLSTGFGEAGDSCIQTTWHIIIG